MCSHDVLVKCHERIIVVISNVITRLINQHVNVVRESYSWNQMSQEDHTVVISNVMTGSDSWYQMSLEDHKVVISQMSLEEHTVMILNATTRSHRNDIKWLYRIIQSWYQISL